MNIAAAAFCLVSLARADAAPPDADAWLPETVAVVQAAADDRMEELKRRSFERRLRDLGMAEWKNGCLDNRGYQINVGKGCQADGGWKDDCVRIGVSGLYPPNPWRHPYQPRLLVNGKIGGGVVYRDVIPPSGIDEFMRASEDLVVIRNLIAEFTAKVGRNPFPMVAETCSCDAHRGTFCRPVR